MPPLTEAPGTFLLLGKVAVREGEERFSANMRWWQRGEAFEMDLWGPLGQGRVHIVKNDAQIELRSARGEVLTEGNPETVMREQLGWALPIDILPAWVQGEPLDGVASQGLSYDAGGHLKSFDQLGWHVELDRYQTVSDGVAERDLPTRITATNGRSRLRLVVSEWQI